MTSAEAARILGVSEKAVEKQRQKLKRDFQGGGGRWEAEVFMNAKGQSMPISTPKTGETTMPWLKRIVKVGPSDRYTSMSDVLASMLCSSRMATNG